MLGPFGLKVWDKVSVSGTISEGEDIQNAYQQLDKILESAHQPAIAALDEYRGIKTRVLYEQPSAEIQHGINIEFEAIKAVLEPIEFREDAQECVNTNYPDWKMAIDVKQIINSKPNKK